MKHSTGTQRGAALLLAMLTLAVCAGLAATLLTRASEAVARTRAGVAEVQAERIASDLEPLLLEWSSRDYTSDNEDPMPPGWNTIHTFRHGDTRIRIRALDLSALLALHGVNTIPVNTAEGYGNPISDGGTLIERSRSTDTTTPFVTGTHADALVEQWVSHVRTHGRIPAAKEQSSRPRRVNRLRLDGHLKPSDTFVFLIDYQRPGLIHRVWLVATTEHDQADRPAGWSIIERRRLP